MKNFTNNFKQFTSRLSARWLIMALMLLLGTSSVWAVDVYFENTLGWSSVHVYVSNNTLWNGDNGCTTNGATHYQMTNISGNLWKCSPSSTFNYIIFMKEEQNNYNNIWNTEASYRSDYSSSTPLFTPSTISNQTTNGTIYYSDGEWSELPAVCVGDRYIAGTSNIFGSDWSTNDPDNKMSCDNITGYSKTYITNFNSDTDIEFKITDGSWSNSWGDNGSNYEHKVKNGCRSVTIKFNGITGEISVQEDASNACCTAPSDVSISGVPSTNPCPGTEFTLTANVGEGDVESYSWSVTGTGWNINGNGNNQTCTFIAGTETGDISLTVSGCSSSDDATTSIEVKSRASKSDFTVSNNEYTYDGTAKAATVKWSDNQSTEGINITYDPASPIDAGSYDIKVTTSEHGDLCASNGDITLDSKLIINQKTPDANDFVYTDQTFTYNGYAQTANVTWKQGYDKTGAITITYKQGDDVKDPINAGIYDVWVTSAASDNFNATESAINKGTLTIDLAKITDVPSNFQLSETSYNYGEEAKPEVSLKQSSTLKQAGLGDITTKYYNSSDQEVANPTAVGTYTVKITMTEGNGYSAITEPTLVGTFTITCPVPAQPQLTIAEGEKVKVCEGKPNTEGYITISNFNSYSNCNLYLGSVDNENKITSNKIAVNAAGTYTIIVENACGESSENSIEIVEEILTPTLTSITIDLNTEKVCAGDNNVTLTCNLVGAIGTPTYKWTKNGEPVGDNSNTIEAGALERNTTFSVSVILDNSGCTKEFTASKDIEVKARPNAPDLGSIGESICFGTKVNLPMIDNNDNNNQINWYNGNKVNPTNLSVLETTTFYAEAVSENGLGCPSNDKTSYTVTVNALPAITLTADNANVNVGETVTLTAAGSNFTSLDWSYTGGTFTPGANNTATLTSDEDANITVTVTATSIDGCTATATIQVIFSSEDCEAESSANYIEVLCRKTDNTRDMYCYAWTGSNTEKLGAWPGQKTKDGEYTYNGTKYAYWKIEGDAINIIFNNSSETQTSNIEGLEKGKRYVFSISTDYNTVTRVVDGEAIFMPEVETTSITPVRNGNTTNVTLEGRVVKKGCANIVWYGFQYSTDGGDTYNDIKAGDTDLELGTIFTKTQAFALGTYMFRAKMINNNGSKVYGEPVRLTVAERDLTIAAIHDDTDVDTDIYYDFVGLYMSSITKATNVEIESYTWYKDGAVYNPAFTESALYGDTYINSNGTNNIRPNQTGVYKLKVALSNSNELESNEITITQANAVSASSILTASNRTLPVISVRTNEDFPTCIDGSFPSAQADKLKKKRSVDVKIFDKNGNLYYDRKARMNYRGSSSLNFVKKSYAFCPGDEMCGDVEKGLDYVITKKVNMFNLGAKDKDWVLYAAAADPSMMRNRIVFDTYANMTGQWGVKSMYVELVVDGEYKGVYVFMDKITNNKDRVNITNSAGFIVKFDKTDIEDRYVNGQDEDSDEKTFKTTRTGKQDVPTYGTTSDQMFEIEYPEKDDHKANWSNIVTSIQKRFENFETALENGDYATVRSIIDYTSWADWFILNEYIKNQDAYRASCIFVYNGEKIEARPVWDQELSMNNTCRTSHGCDNTETLLITTASIYAANEGFPAPFWFTGGNQNITGGLLKDGCFVSLVKERWAMHVADGMPLSSDALNDLLEKFDGELQATNGSSSLNTAQKREAKYWEGKTRSTASCGNGVTGYGNTSYGTEKDNISDWINGNRTDNLGTILNNMTGELSGGISITMSPANGTVTPWVPVTVTVNVPNGDEYTYDDNSITKDITVANDKAITSKNGDVYTYTFPRPEAWGVGNNNGNVKDTRSYIISASLVDQSTECPGLSTDAVVQVKLADEGDDNCAE